MYPALKANLQPSFNWDQPQQKKETFESKVNGTTDHSIPKIDLPIDTVFPQSLKEKIVKKKTTPQIDAQTRFFKHNSEKEEFSDDLIMQYPIYDPNKIIGAAFEEILDAQAISNQNAGSKTINLQYLAWVLNMAMLSLADKDSLDNDTKEALEFAILNSWRKSSPPKSNSSHATSQKSPFMQEDHDYYRYYSKTHQFLNQLYSNKLKVPTFSVDSPLIKEAFHRENPQHVIINSMEEFEKFLDEITTSLQYENEMIFIDLSSMIDSSKLNEDKFYLSKFQDKLRKVAINKLSKIRFPNNNFNSIQHVMFQTQPFAFFEHLGQSLIINFKHSDDDPIDKTFKNYILDTNTKYGFFPNPEQSLMNLLKLNNTSAYKVLKEFNKSYLFKNKYDVCEARLVTGDERKLAAQSLGAAPSREDLGLVSDIQENIGTVFESWEDFTSCSTFKQFEAMSASPNGPPYLKVLPAATVALLKGLNDQDIDKAFKEKGLRDVLQMSYYLMRQAMGEAIFRKDNCPEFNACIELIHQQIQNIFAFVHPYDNTEFESLSLKEYTLNDQPIIPKDIGDIRFHVKASGMRCIASFLGAVESLKGTNALNVVVQKDSYFENKKIFEKVKTYDQCMMDGDLFRKDPQNALTSINKPIDLFVCEFHHNLAFEKHSYYPELVKEQIIALYDYQLAGNPMTVAIDCTISDSSDLRALFENPKIKDYIQKGKLNLVLFRSAQKYDMLGMDNYYGGIMTTVNNGKDFAKFTSRMDDPTDQLGGIHLQGLTHLHKYAAPYLDEFKRSVMASTKLFYSKLPQEAIWNENTTNPMQVSQNHDDKSVFLDIKFQGYSKTLRSVVDGLVKLASDNDLLIAESEFWFSINEHKCYGSHYEIQCWFRR